MSTTTFKAGDEVYDIQGRAGRYVARAAGGHIVEPVYQHEEDGEEVSYDDAVTWREVFIKPPVEKLHADTEAALQKLVDARRQLEEVRQAHYTFEREEKARMDRLKQHEALADLERYIRGEFTHYVSVGDYHDHVEIIPVAETLDSYTSNNGYGLLTLSPHSGWGGGLTWRVTYRDKRDRYSDTRTDKVFPCCGEEAAKAKAKELMERFAAAMAAKPLEHRPKSSVEFLVTQCEKFGATVPQTLRDGLELVKRNQAARDLEKATLELQKAQQAVAALTPGAAA